MSPMIDFSESDMLRNKIVEPAWYRVHIDEVGEWTPSKDQQSQNCNMEGHILFNADNGDTACANVPLFWNFNTKAKGFAEGFLKAFGVSDIEVGKRYDLGAAKGKDLDIYVENDVYQGRKVNRVNHKYRTPRQAGE